MDSVDFCCVTLWHVWRDIFTEKWFSVSFFLWEVFFAGIKCCKILTKYWNIGRETPDTGYEHSIVVNLVKISQAWVQTVWINIFIYEQTMTIIFDWKTVKQSKHWVYLHRINNWINLMNKNKIWYSIRVFSFERKTKNNLTSIYFFRLKQRKILGMTWSKVKYGKRNK